MKRSPNNSGFTLIELLVAMAIMATIASMVYGSYAATSQSLDIYSSRLTCSQRAGQVLRLMSRQIRCAYAPTTEPNVTESSVFCGNARDSRGTILSFATTAGLGTSLARARGLSRVQYRFDSIAAILSIDSKPYVDLLRREEHTESWRPILRNVTSVDIEFHDGRQWQRHWDGKRRKGLPRAVKIAIATVDEKGRPFYFETTTPILSRVAMTTNQSERKPGGGEL